MRIAIVGYGTAGRAYGMLLQQQPEVRVTCVVDTDPTRAKAGARATRASAWSSDVSTAFRRKDVDAVVVASPHASHSQLAREALDRGRHVLLEAPLAIRFPDAQQVLAHARASNAVLAVNFWARVTPGVRLIRRRIPRPTFVQIEAVVDSLHNSWAASAEHGGILGLLGSHTLDLACFLMQSRPISVQAMGGRHTRRADLADTVATGIRFASGGLARVIVGEYGQSHTCSFWRALATDGLITATANGVRPREATEVGMGTDPGNPGAMPSATGQRESLQAFVDAVSGIGKPLAGVEDGVRAVQLADAVYEAMSSRRRIQVDETALEVGVGPIYADDSVPNRRYNSLRS